MDNRDNPNTRSDKEIKNGAEISEETHAAIPRK
jgi:hypothetical protein